MMTVTREELAAWADGEIEGERADRIAAAVEAAPQLQREVAAHRALKARLGAHFAPILQQDVPERLSGMLRGEDRIVDFAAARERSQRKRGLPRWTWIAGPALAASLVLVAVLPDGQDQTGGYASPQLAAALDTQLTAQQGAGETTRIALSFRNGAGEYCRVFGGEEASGIACRDDGGWRIAATGAGAERSDSEFRQAGAAMAPIMEQAQDMAAGPALDTRQEAAARAAGWR